MSSRTHSRPRIKADILVVGIDVAKRTHVAAIRKPDGTKEKPFPFGNDRSGFERLRARSERTRERLGLNGVGYTDSIVAMMGAGGKEKGEADPQRPRC